MRQPPPHLARRSRRRRRGSPGRGSGRAQRAVARARSAGDLRAGAMQAVLRIEHATRGRRARHAPRRAATLDDARALLVGSRGRIEHAGIGGRAGAADVKARAVTAREARVVRRCRCVVDAGRRQASDVGNRAVDGGARSAPRGCGSRAAAGAVPRRDRVRGRRALGAAGDGRGDREAAHRRARDASMAGVPDPLSHAPL